MKVRRIVTGHSPAGKSIFASDGRVPRSSHAWRNKSDKPATMMFVLVGAARK